MNWFERKRIEWIHESLRIYGFINGKHIMKKFSVSSAQATHDLATFNKLYPNTMVYDQSRKCYVETENKKGNANV